MKKHSKLLVSIYDNVRKIITLFSPTLTTKITYMVSFKRPLNLKCPKDFNEKIMWLKLRRYANDPLVKKCVDKYAVREYVEQKGFKDLLNDLYTVYDKPEDIVWSDLPDKFALKYNNGCGCNLICSDKEKLNKEQAIATMKKWLKQKYYLIYAEMQYKGVPSKIVCEKYLEGLEKLPIDYKFFCFYGKPVAVLAISGRDSQNEKKQYFDTTWKFLGSRTGVDELVEKPNSLEKMIEACEVLAKPFPFVRMDFYEVEQNAVFGEMTFTPAGGIGKSYPDNVYQLLSDTLVLPEE